MSEAPTPEVRPARSARWRAWWEEIALPPAIAASVLLAVATVLPWAARWHWTLDLLAHFPVQTVMAALAMLLILLTGRRWKTAALPFLVLAVNLGYVLPLYLPACQATASGETIRAVSANVLRSNVEHARFVAYIRRYRPDFFLIMEIDEAWLAGLEPLVGDYPYRVVQTRQDNFGIGLLSRVPIHDDRVVESAASGLPAIVATLVFRECTLAVIGAHPPPPVGRTRSEMRNGQLRELGDLARELSGSKLLLGDLNTTSWSPHFTALLRRSGMRDGRKGFGIQPTWPGFPWLMRIPIDHTLVSDGVEVVARRVGPDVGSDHRPVEIEFRFAD